MTPASCRRSPGVQKPIFRMIPPEGETLEKNQQFPYKVLQQKVYPNNPDKDNNLKALERLRRIMLLVIFLLKVSLYDYVRISL